jgi:hypothetical protein
VPLTQVETVPEAQAVAVEEAVLELLPLVVADPVEVLLPLERQEVAVET